MTFLEKINIISEQLLSLKDKLYSIDEDLLVEKSDKIELAKLKELLDFYIASIIEMVIEDNQSFVNNNKDLVKSLIQETEIFIKTVNNSLMV